MARRRRRARPRLRRWLVSAFILLCSCLALALGGYTLWLDHLVRQRFDSARWRLPAHVYARPLVLYPGQRLSRHGLITALQRLGYRRLSRIGGIGSFAVHGHVIILRTRPFAFPDGVQKSRSVRLRFSDARVEALSDRSGARGLRSVRLDPLLIGSIYPRHGADRLLIRLSQAPALLRKGLVAVEDRTFYTNPGIDVAAMARALVVDLFSGRIVEGGSTLSQQLVKNFFLGNERTLRRKFNEAIMAVLLNVHYSKHDILSTYLNEVYLGQEGNRSIHGFALGSRFYFNKPLSELEPQEIALLVGLVKGPSYYDPRRHPKRALRRRNVVLSVFARAGLIPAAQAARDERLPLGVTAQGIAPGNRYPAFVDLVRRQLLGEYPERVLTSSGLRIFTTLDPSIQQRTQADVTRGLARLERRHHLPANSLQGAAVVTSADNGEVLALVGGRRGGFAGFNRALDAYRQVGSLLKPAIYLTALEHPHRYTLVSTLRDQPISVHLRDGKVWRPRNYDRTFHGNVPLYSALAHSYNVATVRLGMSLGLPAVIATLHRLGLDRKVRPLPSLLLGAVPLSPFEVAQMYNTLASGGFYNPLLAIKAVTATSGSPLKRYPLETRPAVPSAPLFLDTWAMNQVFRLGTGRSAYSILSPHLTLAGKTGTTDDLDDSWFAGFGANLSAVVWVGRDNHRTTHLTGATGALQIWSHLMRDNGVESLDMKPPADVEQARVPVRSVAGTGDGCAGAIRVPFIRGSEPKGVATCAGRGPHGSSGGPLEWLRRLWQ